MHHNSHTTRKTELLRHGDFFTYTRNGKTRRRHLQALILASCNIVTCCRRPTSQDTRDDRAQTGHRPRRRRTAHPAQCAPPRSAVGTRWSLVFFVRFPWVFRCSRPVSIGCFAAVRAHGCLLLRCGCRARPQRAVALPLSPRLHRVLLLATLRSAHAAAAPTTTTRLYKPSLILSKSSSTSTDQLALPLLCLN